MNDFATICHPKVCNINLVVRIILQLVVAMVMLVTNLSCQPIRAAQKVTPPKQVTSKKSVSWKMVIPFRLKNSKILIAGWINGKQATFCLDTGAQQSAITAAAAQRLGIRSQGQEVRATGIGGTVQIPLTKLTTVQIGTSPTPIILREDKAAILPQFLNNLGFDAIIGYNFLRHYVTSIDFEAKTLTLTLPDQFKPLPSAHALPMHLVNCSPCVPVELDGIKASILLDTGDYGSLTLSRPFVEGNGLRARYPRSFDFPGDKGIGGSAKKEMTRAGRLIIGGVQINKPIVYLSLQTQGTFASASIDGILGNMVLSRFLITLDYSHQQIFLTPNHKIALPFTYDEHSGIMLGIDHPGADHPIFYVVSVVPGSPAAKAGIHSNDEILGVNDIKAEILTFEYIIGVINASPGRRVHLLIRSHKDGKPHRVTLTLQNLI